MSTEEELTKQIADLGDAIKQAKADKKPKEEWDPLLKEMLATKVSYIIWLVQKETKGLKRTQPTHLYYIISLFSRLNSKR
jgi:hypothetical protein